MRDPALDQPGVQALMDRLMLEAGTGGEETWDKLAYHLAETIPAPSLARLTVCLATRAYLYGQEAVTRG